MEEVPFPSCERKNWISLKSKPRKSKPGAGFGDSGQGAERDCIPITDTTMNSRESHIQEEREKLIDSEPGPMELGGGGMRCKAGKTKAVAGRAVFVNSLITRAM